MSTAPAQADASFAGQRLVLCFDGTNNNLTGGVDDTNVVKLCQLLDQAPGHQTVYYDPGVGNAGAIPGVTFGDRWRGKRDRLMGLAFGKGIYENIAEAYIFLMRHWRPQDRIYVLGFSRGAFTARSVAAMVARFGILRPSMESLVPTLVHLYFADPRKDEEKKAHYKQIVAQIGRDYCTPDGAKAAVWFVGVWDTVASVGAPFSRQRIHASGSIIGKRFVHVRQALALDEHRRSFLPRPYYVHPAHDYASQGQSLDQRWFSGAHCDVGGGYVPDQARLSDQCLLWLLGEACAVGLQTKPGVWNGTTIDADAVATLLGTTAARQQARALVMHSETFTQPYWALTGLCVRDTTRAEGEPGDPPAKAPVHHPPTEGPTSQAPRPAYHARVPWTQVIVAALVALLAVLLHGLTLSGGVTASPSALACIGAWLDANTQLVQWQLTWWQDVLGGSAGRTAPAGLPNGLLKLLLIDLVLIAAYGYLVCLLVARGFANAAGPRSVGERPPVWLNLLGWSACAVVGADLAENMFMALVVLAHQWPSPSFEWAFAWLMSAAAALKWLALLPVAFLALRSLLPAKPPAARRS